MSYRKEEIGALVRKVVNQVMGESLSLPTPAQVAKKAKRPLLDADHVNQLPPNTPYTVPANALITPLARQAALERHIHLPSQAKK